MNGRHLRHATLINIGNVPDPALGHIRHVHAVGLFQSDLVIVAPLAGRGQVAGAGLVELATVVHAVAAALDQVGGAALVGDEDVVGAVLIEVQLLSLIHI